MRIETAEIGCGCLALLVLFAIVMPPIGHLRPRPAARTTACKSNLKQLSNALMLYAADWNDRLPPVERWTPAVETKLGWGPRQDGRLDPRFRCPSVRDGDDAYAMNGRTSALKIAAADDPTAVVVLFETDLFRRNATGSAADVASPGRHPGVGTGGCERAPDGSNYAFLDGHVKWLEAPPSFAVPLKATKER